MDVKLKVGDKVRCVWVSEDYIGTSKGSVYIVTGAEGDSDYSRHGVRMFEDGLIFENGFNFADDDEDIRYGEFPLDRFNQWELVTD